MNNSPFDQKSAFFSDYFARSLPYADYRATGTPTQVERWEGFEKALELSAAQTNVIKDFTRKLHLLTLSGIWCGDCMRQGPMLQKIAAASPWLDLRFIDNNENPELRDQLRIAGGARIPVVVALSEDFFEVGRFGDRTLSHYRAKANRELGPACDSGLGGIDTKELHSELSEWLDFIERMQLILRLSPFLRSRHND
jgi:thiol-disulfide isomerase/thioredoxin